MTCSFSAKDGGNYDDLLEQMPVHFLLSPEKSRRLTRNSMKWNINVHVMVHVKTLGYISMTLNDTTVTGAICAKSQENAAYVVKGST
jgi:hypothetical protein